MEVPVLMDQSIIIEMDVPAGKLGSQLNSSWANIQEPKLIRNALIPVTIGLVEQSQTNA